MSHLIKRVISYLHPGYDNWIPDPSSSHHNLFRSQEICLSSVLVPSHPRPGPLTSRQASRFTSPPHPSSTLSQSTSLYFHFTSILVTSHLHPGPQIASQLHPGTISSSSRIKDVRLTSIQVRKIASQIQAATMSNSPRFQDMSQLHTGPVPSESRFQYTCITSFHVPPDLHPGPISSGSGSNDFSLTSIHVLSQPNPGPYSHITPPSKQCLNSIQVLIFMLHINPGQVSPPSRSEDVWYTSINALSHLQPGHSPRLRFTSTHVLISASHHHPGDVSPPSSSRNLHLSSIQVLSQSHPGLKMCVSHPFRPCLRFNEVTEFLPHLHPSTAYPPSRSLYSYLTSLQVLIFTFHI